MEASADKARGRVAASLALTLLAILPVASAQGRPPGERALPDPAGSFFFHEGDVDWRTLGDTFARQVARGQRRLERRIARESQRRADAQARLEAAEARVTRSDGKQALLSSELTRAEAARERAEETYTRRHREYQAAVGVLAEREARLASRRRADRERTRRGLGEPPAAEGPDGDANTAIGISLVVSIGWLLFAAWRLGSTLAARRERALGLQAPLTPRTRWRQGAAVIAAFAGAVAVALIAAGIANEHARAVELAAAEQEADRERITAAGNARPRTKAVLGARERVGEAREAVERAEAAVVRRTAAVARARAGPDPRRRVARWRARRDWRARIVSRHDRRLAALRSCDPAFELTHCHVP